MKDEDEAVELQEDEDVSGMDVEHLRDLIDQIDENTLDARQLASEDFIDDYSLNLDDDDAKF